MHVLTGDKEIFKNLSLGELKTPCQFIIWGGGEGALAFKGKMFIRIPKCCQVWHSGRKFVHYDMFLPVTFPAKNKKCL